jgi:rubrerythrin
MESDGIEMYEGAARNCANALGQKMFLGLAEDEKSHIRMIEAIAEGLELSAALEKARSGTPRERIKTLFSEARDKVVGKAAAAADDVTALKTALGLEKESYDFYRKAAGETSCADEEALFKRLLKEENEHFEILQNMLEYLENTGNWFLWEEEGLLDGA